MPQREPELDHVTNLLGQCLERIEQQVARLADDDADLETLAAGCVFDDEAGMLQELVESLLDGDAPSCANLNTTVQRAVQTCLGELTVPVVVRELLAPDLPMVACSPGELTFAVQRGLVLGVGRIAPGGEVLLTTRCDGAHVVFEIETHGTEVDRYLPTRSETLAEIVASLRGQCRVSTRADGSVHLALEQPVEPALDDR